MDLGSLPAHLLRVPPAEFAARLAALAQHWAAHQDDRHAAGALVCGQWIAGLHDRHPLTGQAVERTADSMGHCQIAADAIVYGMRGHLPGIDHRWAEGVAAMVAWARGASRWPPIELPGERLVA